MNRVVTDLYFGSKIFPFRKAQLERQLPNVLPLQKHNDWRQLKLYS